MAATTSSRKYTTKDEFRAAVITAMNDIRAKGNEPGWASVSRHIEDSGILTEHDKRLNPSADAHTGFEHVWQTTLSFVATDMKNDGILYREPQAPWILLEWGITTAELTQEITGRRARVIRESSCGKCFTIHRPEIECW